MYRFNQFLIEFLTILFLFESKSVDAAASVTSERRLICLDTKTDLESSGWSFNTEIKSVDNSRLLPTKFGDLKSLDGVGIWYLEGSGSGTTNKEITFKSPKNPYASGRSNGVPKSVTMYIKYYDNSPRRATLYPAKANADSGSLKLLPVSTTGKWTEIKQEIDPTESPMQIELTAVLSTNQYILFEKIVLAIDTPLPSDVTLKMSCSTLKSSLTTTEASTITPPNVTPTKRPISLVTSTLSPQGIIIPKKDSSQAECPALPQLPECKCNCNCNCAKC